MRLAERVKRIGGVMAGARVVRQRRAVLDTVLAHRAAVVDAAAPCAGRGPRSRTGIAFEPDTDVRRWVVGL